MSDRLNDLKDELEFDQKKFLGIKTKIGLLIGASLILCIATTVAIGNLLTSQLFQRVYKTNVTTITSLAAQQVPMALRFGRTDPIIEVIEGLKAQTDGSAQAFVVLDNSGRVLISLGDDVSELAKLESTAQSLLTTGSEAGAAVAPLGMTAKHVEFGPEKEIVGVFAIAWDMTSNFAALTKNSIISILVSLAIAAFGIIVSVIFVSRMVTRPIDLLTDSMDNVASGNFKKDIPAIKRGDEIGIMAQRLMGFRDTLAKEEEERTLRRKQDVLKGKLFDELTSGLSSVSEGDLSPRLDPSLAKGIEGDYERVCNDFNHMLEEFGKAISKSLDSAETVNSNALEISSVSKEQSARSEQQASTLEQSANSLQKLTESVRNSAQQASQADEFISENRRQAETSGELVSQTIGAMRKIEKSSEQINEIISVIDDIAFQTNLLALNAGVEAARAGDAGRGFAVVASEVRALAQRASHSASEIKELISNSTQQVSEGGMLVTDTGEALQKIIVQVTRVSELVSSMAQSSQNQSESLEEISQSVSDLDRVTQQNVAVIEETSASSQSLSQEAQSLRAVLAQFTINSGSKNSEATDLAVSSGETEGKKCELEKPNPQAHVGDSKKRRAAGVDTPSDKPRDVEHYDADTSYPVHPKNQPILAEEPDEDWADF